MRKFNLSNITVELEDNFNEALKDGLVAHRDGETLWYTEDIDVTINGDNNYYGYYTGRYPNNLTLEIYCKKCDSFVMSIACNVGGELKKILMIDQTTDGKCKHFPSDEEDD